MLEKLDISFSGLGRDDIGTDVDIDINNSPDGGNSNNSNDEAVIALSIVLALVLLGIIAGLLYYKRRFGVDAKSSLIQSTYFTGLLLHSSTKR